MLDFRIVDDAEEIVCSNLSRDELTVDLFILHKDCEVLGIIKKNRWGLENLTAVDHIELWSRGVSAFEMMQASDVVVMVWLFNT